MNVRTLAADSQEDKSRVCRIERIILRSYELKGFKQGTKISVRLARAGC